jgi:hypothetical protein
MIMTSSDGVSWTTSGTTNVLYGIAYGNSTYVAVGDQGMIITSSDGASWTSRTSGTWNSLYGIAYGNNTYVAVGYDGTIVTSSDGMNWTSRTSGTRNWLRGVTYGNGTYVAVGLGGKIVTSSDGVNWTSRTSDNWNSSYGVAYGNGMYVAVGDNGINGSIMTSSDGVNWTHLTPELERVAYGNGTYVIVGQGGTIETSSDGANWTSRTSGTMTWLNGIAYGNGTYVAVGQGGTIVTSSDGAGWTSRTSGTTNALYDVVYGNGTYVAVGLGGTIVTSSDGVSWTSRTLGTTNFLLGVAYGNGTYVAVGLGGTIVTSSDGVNWTSRTSGTTNWLQGVVYGNGTYAAVGYGGTIVTSSDGVSWTSRTSGTTNVLISVAYGNGTYAAVGYGGTIVTSSDGVSWMNRTSGTTNVLIGVAYGNSKYVVAGTMRTILKSASIADAGNNGVTASTSVITKGSSITLAAYGDRQSAAGAMAGDERYVPTSWSSTETGKTGTFSLSGGSYTSTYTPSAADANGYTVTATFKKQSWNGSQWTDSGATDTKTTTVIVNALVDASTPVIGSQPADQTVNIGGSAPLSVVATVSDSGTLSYQWYSNTTNSNIGGTAITGATNASYTELTTTAGTTYYYVVVTNTNNSVNGTKTATATSSVAKVTVTSLTHAATPTASPIGGAVASGTNVMLSTATSGATIYYTTEGSTPTNSSTAYSTPISVTNAMTIKAIAVKSGMTNSDIMSESYTMYVPGAPTIVSAAAGNGQINLSWNPVSGSTGYEVYKSVTSDTYGAAVATVSGSVYSYNVTGLANGTTYYFAIKATYPGGESAASNQIGAMPRASSNGSIYSTPTQPSDSGAVVYVNGRAESAGTASTTKVGDQTVTTITVDEKKLAEKLTTAGEGAVVTIMANTKSDAVVVELNGQMVMNMEQKNTVVEIKTENASYTLPAQQINMNAVLEQFGKTVALQEIKIQIEIAKPSSDTVKIVKSSAAIGEFTIAAPPLNFTVKASYEGKTIEISTFNVYVERTIAIPDSVAPDKVTTGVIFDPDGTVRHVPTEMVMIDGKYYAKINSLTNSTYAIVWHPIEFKDVVNHWAKNAVNDMGSRMVIDGTGNGMFSPDREITRAEFAAVIVRALGLKPQNGTSSFSDVKATDWHDGAINTAYAYRLISGFEDGTFRPNDKITREQAMVMISEAMKITNLKSMLSVQSTNVILHSFTDASDVSAWAQSSMTDSVQSGIVSGRSGTLLAPKDYITRAEVAVIVQRLLQKSNLI